SVSRPGELPASDLTNAFRKDDVPANALQAATVKPSTAVPPPPAAPQPAPQPSASPTPAPAPQQQPFNNGKPTVFVDPGHGAKEIGASAKFDDGSTILEKDLNLRVASRLADLLKAAGFNVVQSRTADAQVNATRDLTGDGKIALADDLQARVDAA